MLAMAFMRDNYAVYLLDDIMGYKALSLYTFEDNGEPRDIITIKFNDKQEIGEFLDRLRKVVEQ